MNAPFKVGDKVIFGRARGQQTKGTVVKMNRTKAKVRQDEERGTLKDHKLGGIWTVPFSLMRMDPDGGNNTGIPGAEIVLADQPIPASRYLDSVDQHILEAILGIYNKLSPENLSCDGELPTSQVRSKARQLKHKLKALEEAYGLPVSEDTVYAWARENLEKKTA